jgi:hypothetical protein
MTRHYLKSVVIAALVTLAPSFANAHYLWFAQQANGAPIIHFGEFNEGLIERSPGRMDEMPAISAFIGTTPLTVTKTASHFALSGIASTSGPITAQELTYPIKDWRANGIGIVKPMYYARFARLGTTATPSLPLDIIPAADGKSVRVYMGTIPLVGATVSFYAPNGWLKSDKTDASGNFAINMPWRGQYVAEVIHLERTAGTFNGGAYEAIRHRATTTLIQTRGAATFPITTTYPH